MDASTKMAKTILNVSEKEFLQCFKDARSEIHRRLGGTASSHYRLLYFQRTIERLGLGSQLALAFKLEETYWAAFLAEAKIRDEAMDFLDDLRLAGIPAVFVTDLTAEIQFRKLLFWRMDRYIDWVVTSQEAGADKPNARIFELALAKLGGVEGNVWMLGDNEERDILGAKNAVDATTIHFKNTGEQPSPNADFVVNSFSEVRKILRKTGFPKQS